VSGATAGQADDVEIPVRLVQLLMCDPCIDGEGDECHTPGCALWIHDVPKPSLRAMVTIIDAAKEPQPAPELAMDDDDFFDSVTAAIKPQPAPSLTEAPFGTVPGDYDEWPDPENPVTGRTPGAAEPVPLGTAWRLLNELRDGVTALAADLDASAAATRPSKKSTIEDELAIALRKLLEDE
jgi:hypothetical protein